MSREGKWKESIKGIEVYDTSDDSQMRKESRRTKSRATQSRITIPLDMSLVLEERGEERRG